MTIKNLSTALCVAAGLVCVQLVSVGAGALVIAAGFFLRNA